MSAAKNAETRAEAAPDFDVAIVGGALAGSACAIQLQAARPGLRVLVIEKTPRFGRRVGEATVEVSAYLLTRVLGLTRYLNENHIVKQGFRFWFCNDRTGGLDRASEIGGRYLARVPAFQVDRSALDEEVLRRAREGGAEVWRPATVDDIELSPGGVQRLNVRRENRREQVRARWVVDASGVAAFLARRNSWFMPNTDHPTAAVWARWRGVGDWDGLELARRYPEWSAASHGMRGPATNHLMGDGWWAWIIPLKGGDTSVGVVFDQRRVDWPQGTDHARQLKAVLISHPVGREILGRAEIIEGDVHSRRNLAWRSATFAGDGFVLVGDAAGFLDPLYSPGLDWLAFTTSTAARLIVRQQEGADMTSLVTRHNTDFSRSYDRWFQAVFRDKYDYLGDFELMRIGFKLDLGFYYLGVASQPYRRGSQALCEPMFSLPPAYPFYMLMRLYNRRLAAMGRNRRIRGCYGRRNTGVQTQLAGYTFSIGSLWPLVMSLAGWMVLELKEGWRSWFRVPGRSRESGRAWGLESGIEVDRPPSVV